MEPMLEIFLDESQALVEELEEVAYLGKEGFSKEDINTIFRVVHTLKADATMMLIENIAELSRTMERVLYYVRDENKVKLNGPKFLDILVACIEFIKCELHKIESGFAPNGNYITIQKDINDYFDFLTHKNEVVTPDEEQVYYISSVETTKSLEDIKYYMTTAHFIQGNVELKEKVIRFLYVINSVYDSNSSYFPNDLNHEDAMHIIMESGLIIFFASESERQDINDILEDFDDISSLEIKELKDEADMEKTFAEYVSKYNNYKANTKGGKLVGLEQLYKKMEFVVADMNKNLNRSVILNISGDDIRIEKKKFEKLSNAMIHIVRNAMDHGIESEEQRIQAHKIGFGKIAIHTTKNPSGFQITISDDGSGLDKERIKKKAIERGMISNDYCPTDKEIYSYILEPGFTTRDVATDYSGRGVGLDAANYNIQKVGGYLKIDSTPGVGTIIDIIFP